MHIHIIGNGPSKEYFQNTPVGAVFGCNYGEPKIQEMKTVFIHDTRVFHNIQREKKPFPYDIITRVNFESYANKLRQMGYIPGNVTYLPRSIREKSTGHDALHFFVGCKDIEEIHLWGFDSIHSGDMSSDSRDKIQGSAQILKLLPLWQQRFKRLGICARRVGKKVIVHQENDRSFIL